MGNIALAFHLLCERASPNSFWQPYIQTLPSEYDTPLYFEEEEVRCLQSTQAIHDVFSQYKNTARQYAYFYKVIQVSRVGQNGPVHVCPSSYRSLSTWLLSLRVFRYLSFIVPYLQNYYHIGVSVSGFISIQDQYKQQFVTD